MYRRQAVQSQSAAVVHEGLTPGAVPNDGPQLAKGEGALTGKVKATMAGSNQPAAAPLHSSGQSRGTQGAQGRHKGIGYGAAKRPTTYGQSKPKGRKGKTRAHKEGCSSAGRPDQREGRADTRRRGHGGPAQTVGQPAELKENSPGFAPGPSNGAEPRGSGTAAVARPSSSSICRPKSHWHIAQGQRNGARSLKH